MRHTESIKKPKKPGFYFAKFYDNPLWDIVRVPDDMDLKWLFVVGDDSPHSYLEFMGFIGPIELPKNIL